MRHYMVDPDNEERLLKVPPHVVERIKAEAYAEAIAAVIDAGQKHLCGPRACVYCVAGVEAVAAIEGLSPGNRTTEAAHGDGFPMSVNADRTSNDGERRHLSSRPVVGSNEPNNGGQ